MNIIVWSGECSRCHAPVNDDAMDLFIDLKARPVGMELICKNTLLCQERQDALNLAP